jgi:hypothetical protein
VYQEAAAPMHDVRWKWIKAHHVLITLVRTHMVFSLWKWPVVMRSVVHVRCQGVVLKIPIRGVLGLCTGLATGTRRAADRRSAKIPS